jgi:glucosamine-6-phosphate deaminase
MKAEEFRGLGTRIVSLTRETITINSNTALRGAFDLVPKQAITVGFRQIMEARRLRIYLNRPWQGAVVRKLLFGEIWPGFPASFARNHADAALTMTTDVATRPAFALK